jgi:hypothetical protein
MILGSSIQARFFATVFGNPAVVVAALIAFVFVAYSPLEVWPKVLAFAILGSLIVGGAFRLFRGGEQGTTDLEVTPGRLQMTNIPLSIASAILTQGLHVYQRQLQPLPKPLGVVTGNPAESTGVSELPSAGLPDQAELAEQTIEVPPGAVPVSGTRESA